LHPETGPCDLRKKREDSCSSLGKEREGGEKKKRNEKGVANVETGIARIEKGLKGEKPKPVFSE